MEKVHEVDTPSSLSYRLHNEKKKSRFLNVMEKRKSVVVNVTLTRGSCTSESQIGILGRLVKRAGKLVIRERCHHHLCNDR